MAVRNGFVSNVHVVGPKELIEQMKRPDFTPRPKALVEVSSTDVGEVKQKTLTYELPKGVDVTDEDKKRTLEFRVVERGAGE